MFLAINSLVKLNGILRILFNIYRIYIKISVVENIGFLLTKENQGIVRSLIHTYNYYYQEVTLPRGSGAN